MANRTRNPEPTQPIAAEGPREDGSHLMTVERFVRTLGDKVLSDAFVRTEQLLRGTRKLSKEDWQTAFEEWKNAARD